MNKDFLEYLKENVSNYRRNKLEMKRLSDYNKKIATMILDNKKDIDKLSDLEKSELLGDISLEELQELIDNEW